MGGQQPPDAGKIIWITSALCSAGLRCTHLPAAKHAVWGAVQAAGVLTPPPAMCARQGVFYDTVRATARVFALRLVFGSSYGEQRIATRDLRGPTRQAPRGVPCVYGPPSGAGRTLTTSSQAALARADEMVQGCDNDKGDEVVQALPGAIPPNYSLSPRRQAFTRALMR